MIEQRYSYTVKERKQKGKDRERPLCKVCGRQMMKNGCEERGKILYQRWSCWQCRKEREKKGKETQQELFAYGKSWATYNRKWATLRPLCPACKGQMKKNTTNRKERIRWYCGKCNKSLYVLLERQEQQKGGKPQKSKPMKILSLQTQKTKEEIEKSLPVLREMDWNKDLQKIIVEKEKPAFLHYLLTFFQTHDKKACLDAIHQGLFPSEVMEMIEGLTQCNKWVEKSTLTNLILTALCYFSTEIAPKAAVTLKGLTFHAEGGLARILNVQPMSDNALGTRIIQEKTIAGLEQYFQFTSYLLGSQAFEKPQGTLLPIYYDWVYFQKDGAHWELCKEVTTDAPGIKVGIARDWKTLAIVGLIAHIREHPGDRDSLEQHLLVEGEGIIHVSDSGPLAIPLLQTIDERGQYFIIRSREDTKKSMCQHIKRGQTTYMVKGRPIVVLREEIVTLRTKDAEIRRCKELTLRVNGQKGTYEVITIVTNLPLDAETIVRTGYWRLPYETVF